MLIVHENAAVLELIERSLLAAGTVAVSTRDWFEAFEIARWVELDVLVVGDDGGGARDLRTFQPDVQVVELGPPPVSLPALVAEVAAARAKKNGGGP